MPRLFRDDGWYDLVPPGSMTENDFERILCQNSDLIASACYLRPFKLMVRGDERDGIPDLVLIDHEYRFWWVIEVERSHHDLFRHVLPQVRCFKTASYGSEAAEYIYSLGSECAFNLYTLTGEEKWLEEAFTFAEKRRASLLLQSLRSRQAHEFAHIPDALLQKRRSVNDLAKKELEKWGNPTRLGLGR